MRKLTFTLLALTLLTSTVDAATVLPQVTTTNDGTNLSFTLTYSTPPDFFSSDAFGNQADSFQLFMGNPVSVVVRGEEIHYGGGIPFRTASGTDPDPHSGGWGPIIASVPFTLTSNTLSFMISLALLNDATSITEYATFHYGSLTGFHSATVPLPTTLPLFAIGFGLLLTALRRRT